MNVISLNLETSFSQPIYKDVLSKEHEVIMLLNKGRELLGRNAYQQQQRSDRSQQRDLDKIQQHWEKLRKDVSDRHNRLQTCMVSWWWLDSDIIQILIMFGSILRISRMENKCSNKSRFYVVFLEHFLKSCRSWRSSCINNALVDSQLYNLILIKMNIS